MSIRSNLPSNRLVTLAALAVCFGSQSLASGCDDTDTVDRFGTGVGGSGGDGNSSNDGGASASDGGGSSEGGGPSSPSSSAAGGAASCPDSGEPNDTEAEAADLGMIDDCDDSGASVQGVLAGDDVDWYVYHGEDATGCVVDPFRQVTADGTYRICQFAECDGGGELEVTCPEDTSSETSPDGRPGCCAQTAFALGIDCPGFTDSAKIWVRLDKPPAFECVSYTLNYHY